MDFSTELLLLHFRLGELGDFLVDDGVEVGFDGLDFGLRVG